jgi:galactose mutarotase-like enzyme
MTDTFRRASGLLTHVLETAAARAEILPGRGALVTRLVLGGEELLYLDERTLDDPTQNVRGGIPVLFPIAGRLPDDAWTHAGRTFPMKQHGFARKRAFAVIAHEKSASVATLTCRLRSDDDTLAVYPWPFELDLTFTLRDDRFTISTTLASRGPEPLVWHLGFHPYFRVADATKAGVRITSPATRALDNRTGAVVPAFPLDFTASELDRHLLDHAGDALLHRPGARTIRLQLGPEFPCLVVWTLAGRDFVCVEPWTAPAGALATGTGLRTVNPGASDVVAWTVSLDG